MDSKTKDKKFPLFGAKTLRLLVDVVLATDLKKITEKILINLEPEETELLRLRFGMAGCKEQTLEELSTQWDLSSEKLCQIEVKALRHLCELNLNIQQDFAGIKNENKGVWS